MKRGLLPATSKRVQLNTDEETNKAIREQTICKLYELYEYKDANTVLNHCIHELNKEWDTERVLEANAASILLATSLFGLKKSKIFFFTGVISFFLLQHALQGWCPPLPVIRKMGVRTADEINKEKTALKMMRGDFFKSPETVDEMVEMIEK